MPLPSQNASFEQRTAGGGPEASVVKMGKQAENLSKFLVVSVEKHLTGYGCWHGIAIIFGYLTSQSFVTI